MAETAPLGRPSFVKVVLSFVVGILVGVAFVFPTIRGSLATDLLVEPGPIGRVVLVGVLSIVVVTTGMFALYQLFWLVDQ